MIKQFRMTFDPSMIRARNSAQFIRSAAVISIVAGLSLVGQARPTAAALDHGAIQEALVNHYTSLPVRPSEARQGQASKDAHRASEYAALRQDLSLAADSTSSARAFFR